MKYAIVAIGILANASASILIKISHDQKWSATNLHLIFGMILYGVAFLSYAYALKLLPLNVVHPMMTSGGIVLVGILSVIVFRETFSWVQLLGFITILVGIVLINIKL